LIVVIDTNVWVSGLQFGRPGGATYESLERAKDRDTVALSDDLEAEIYRIPGLSLHWPPRRIREALAVVMKRQIRVTLRRHVHVCRDPKDDLFLECAVLANADVLVTGDKDLLTLGSYAGTKIVTPIEYVELAW
jgi:putative PIN family toxin of toxin-antitoxin system